METLLLSSLALLNLDSFWEGKTEKKKVWNNFKRQWDAEHEEGQKNV